MTGFQIYNIHKTAVRLDLIRHVRLYTMMYPQPCITDLLILHDFGKDKLIVGQNPGGSIVLRSGPGGNGDIRIGLAGDGDQLPAGKGSNALSFKSLKCIIRDLDPALLRLTHKAARTHDLIFADNKVSYPWHDVTNLGIKIIIHLQHKLAVLRSIKRQGFVGMLGNRYQMHEKMILVFRWLGITYGFLYSSLPKKTLIATQDFLQNKGN